MNEEIKEILDDLRTYKDKYEYFLFNNLSFSDRDYKAKILLDYITNLQQENERLKEENILLKASEPMSKIAEDYCYKSKCKKANKLLKTICKVLPGTYNQLLIEIDNYLQGSDENE